MSFLYSMWLFVNLVPPGNSQILKGVYVKDARSWKSLTTREESPSFYLPDIEVPAELTVCARYYSEFHNTDGWLMISTKKKPLCAACPGVQLRAVDSSPIFRVMDAGVAADFTTPQYISGSYRENMIRKWNALCWSFDFREANHTLQVAWNGQVSNATTAGSATSSGPGYGSLPWGWNYDMTEPGLNLTLGKYWTGTYSIGKYVDFNAWDRRLSTEEMANYTDCKTYHQPIGNLMHGSDKWIYENEFIDEFEVSWEEVQCSAKNTFTTANNNALTMRPTRPATSWRWVDACQSFDHRETMTVFIQRSTTIRLSRR
jgi:hypothetical protein